MQTQWQDHSHQWIQENQSRLGGSASHPAGRTTGANSQVENAQVGHHRVEGSVASQRKQRHQETQEKAKDQEMPGAFHGCHHLVMHGISDVFLTPGCKTTRRRGGSSRTTLHHVAHGVGGSAHQPRHLWSAFLYRLFGRVP